MFEAFLDCHWSPLWAHSRWRMCEYKCGDFWAITFRLSCVHITCTTLLYLIGPLHASQFSLFINRICFNWASYSGSTTWPSLAILKVFSNVLLTWTLGIVALTKMSTNFYRSSSMLIWYSDCCRCLRYDTRMWWSKFPVWPDDTCDCPPFEVRWMPVYGFCSLDLEVCL